MAMMPLVPETKMADVGKLTGQESHVVSAHNYVCSFDFVPQFWNRLLTRIAYIYSRLPSTQSLTLRLTLTFSYTVTSRDNTHTHSLSLSLTSSTQPHEKVYISQLFSSLFYLYGQTCSSLENNHRNFVKPPREKTRSF